MTGQPGLLQFLLDDELALLDELAAEQPLAAGVPPLPPLVVPPIATGSAAHDAAAMPPLPAAPSAAGTSWPGGGAMTAGPAADTAQPACSSVRHGGDGDGGSGSGDGSGASRRRRGRAGKESAEERERQRALQRAYQARYMQRKQVRAMVLPPLPHAHRSPSARLLPALLMSNHAPPVCRRGSASSRSSWLR